MQSRLADGLARVTGSHGGAGVWEIAAIAAVWPYIAASLQLPSAAYNSAAHWTVALSLVVTLLLIAVLRSKLELIVQAPFAGGLPLKTDATATSPGGAISNSAEMTGFFNRARLQSLVEDRDTCEPIILGVVRVANHAPMVAFDAGAAARVMAAFSRRLEAVIVAKRPAAQTSEDTFVILLEGPTSAAQSELGSIGYVLSQDIAEGELTVSPDIHLGLAHFPNDADNWAGLYSHASTSATPLKRFRMVGSAPAQQRTGDTQAQRFVIEQALRRAVREGQLSLRYQPLVDTAAAQIAGAEVLLRWSHPRLGEVSPAVFVPLLEETGLIHEIGLWTLNSACRQLSAWRSAAGYRFRLAINLSAIQLQTPNLHTVIGRTVASHGLAPEDIELELTETAAMEDQARTVEQLQALRTMGFGIAIDDFGKGHSNLGYLKDLPATKLKIDREFVDHVDSRPSSRAICKAMVELASGLEMTVLAEGVERAEEVSALKSLGCDLFQGYYFARPLTAEQFSETIRDPQWLSSLGSDMGRSHVETKRRVS